jgi:hypothetical protein
MFPRTALAAALICLSLPVAADPPVVEAAHLSGSGGMVTVSATLRHPDTGWDHYADGWRVEMADGTVLGVRDLLHPHVSEQPFTRSLSGVPIPDGVTEVLIRARCNVTGWAPDALLVAVSR